MEKYGRKKARRSGQWSNDFEVRIVLPEFPQFFPEGFGPFFVAPIPALMLQFMKSIIIWHVDPYIKPQAILFAALMKPA